MTKTSDYLEQIINSKTRTCSMQVVFVNIFSYSKRKTYAQVRVIDAFTNSLMESMSETAKNFLRYSQEHDINFKRDIIILPSGDGAAIGFTVEGEHDIHLFFAKELIISMHKNNKAAKCSTFNEQGWCDCRNAFNLRIGASEGKLILYKDINGNHNIAGNTINMSARVMNVADINQIFFTEDAYRLLIEMIPNIDKQFIKYNQVKIKHNLAITVYQYVDDSLEGLNSSPNETLELEEKAIDIDETEIEESGSSIQETVAKNVRLRDKSLQSKVTSEAKSVSTLDKPLKKEMQDHMVLIPAGEFLMGDEKTGQVKVTITNPFMVDKYPVTQALYEKVIG